MPVGGAMKTGPIPREREEGVMKDGEKEKEEDVLSLDAEEELL